MIIGVPKEIKSSENRVAMTPSGVLDLTNQGHTVYVQSTAGNGSSFSDQDYIDAGAKMLPTIEEVYEIAEMIVKVKEPIAEEYDLVREDQLIFTYFHFASSEPLTKAMIKSKSVCLAYETVELTDGSLPLLIPMSEVAGRMAAQQGAKYLEKPQGGLGVLMGGVPGTRPANVVVLGAGVVGTEAARIAAGMGAQVTLLDINLFRLRQLENVMPANIVLQYSNALTIKELIKDADLVIGAVLIPGAKAPSLITKDMLNDMQNGAVIVDVAVDQGGCTETCKPTTHNDPTFVVNGIVHYCVANMPGAVPKTSTLALTNATLPYVKLIAGNGWKDSCRMIPELKLGLNVVQGKVVYEAVANAFGLPYEQVDTILN